MERRVPIAVVLMVAGVIASRLAWAQDVADRSCAETPMIHATPPPTNNAGTLDEGSWWVNEDKTLWLRSATGPWRIGYNRKNQMVKPSGVKPTITGTRIDAIAAPMDVKWVPQSDAEFQTMGLTFASEGCWKITVTAGGRTLDFITRVRPLP